jgi:large subunit ribosomal protein L22
MPGLKTNERPGTRAVLRHSHMSAYKAREVLDLIRGKDYVRASEILEYAERGAADPILKLLNSAAANARHNDGLDPEELFVSACFADEGSTMKRWRPRARGRATRIRKRTCHVTVILSRLPEDELAKRRSKVAAEQAERRARRVAGGRRRARVEASTRGGAESDAAEASDAEALEALEEARTLSDDAQHAELTTEAEAALDQELDHDDEGAAEAEPADDANEVTDAVTDEDTSEPPETVTAGGASDENDEESK